MSDQSSDQTGEARAEAWRKEGRCSACTFFVVDFGSEELFYGHCKMYRRTGSRTAADATCHEFRPLPGFSETVRLTDFSPKAGPAPTERERAGGRALTPSRSARSGGVLRRRRGGDADGMRIVRRRTGEDGPTVARDTTLVNDDVLAALTGASGEGDVMDRDTLRDVLLELIEDHIGIEDCALAPKWEGGTLTLTPGNPELKGYELDLETFFKKIIMLRDRLRVLEQKINAHDTMTSTEKIDLQQYISRCYGSLTSFNILFRDADDRFSSK